MMIKVHTFDPVGISPEIRKKGYRYSVIVNPEHYRIMPKFDKKGAETVISSRLICNLDESDQFDVFETPDAIWSLIQDEQKKPQNVSLGTAPIRIDQNNKAMGVGEGF